MNEIIIDVGANHGEFATEIAKRNPNTEVIAFEPEPSLYDGLIQAQASYTNIKPYKYAIANVDEPEQRNFNVSHSGDMGTSSLLEFSKEHLSNNPYWNIRSDLKHDDVIKVEVRSLASILDEIDFDEISFIKIDTQGFDLEVLKSAGHYFEKIQAGMLEVPAVPSVSLYNNEADTLVDVLSWLKEKDYTVYQIKSNDHAGNEYNVFFHRKDIDIKYLETRLCLKNFPMYDGKDYWFLPSNVPNLQIPSEQNVINRINELQYELAGKINELTSKISQMECKVNDIILLEYKLYELTHKMNKVPFIRRVLALLMPSKELRKKIRGEINDR